MSEAMKKPHIDAASAELFHSMTTAFGWKPPLCAGGSAWRSPDRWNVICADYPGRVQIEEALHAVPAVSVRVRVR